MQIACSGDRIVVERHGEAIAAVVPMSVYRQWQQQRAAFFDQMRAIAERVDLTPEQAEAEAMAADASHDGGGFDQGGDGGGGDLGGGDFGGGDFDFSDV